MIVFTSRASCNRCRFRNLPNHSSSPSLQTAPVVRLLFRSLALPGRTSMFSLHTCSDMSYLRVVSLLWARFHLGRILPMCWPKTYQVALKAWSENKSCWIRRFAFCDKLWVASVALFFAATDDCYRLDSFQLYGLFSATMLVLMKLSRFTVSVSEQFASTRTSLRRALGTTSSLALGSLLITSLQRSRLSTPPRIPTQLSASTTTRLPSRSLGTRFLTIAL